MYCKFCGNEISSDTSKCSSCGAIIRFNDGGQSFYEDSELEVWQKQTVPKTVDIPVVPVPNSPAPRAKKTLLDYLNLSNPRNFLIFLGISAVIIILLSLAIIVNLVGDRKSGEETQKEEQLVDVSDVDTETNAGTETVEQEQHKVPVVRHTLKISDGVNLLKCFEYQNDTISLKKDLVIPLDGNAGGVHISSEGTTAEWKKDADGYTVTIHWAIDGENKERYDPPEDSVIDAKKSALAVKINDGKRIEFNTAYKCFAGSYTYLPLNEYLEKAQYGRETVDGKALRRKADYPVIQIDEKSRKVLIDDRSCDYFEATSASGRLEKYVYIRDLFTKDKWDIPDDGAKGELHIVKKEGVQK